MKRYQQHTHASWHRAYADKFECPWCNENPHRAGSITPQSQNHQRKPSTKGSDAGSTHRTRATATPVGHRIDQASDSVPAEEHVARTPLEPQTPDPAHDTANIDEEASPAHEPVEANYTQYMGGTVRQDGLNSAFASDKPRPPLPEEWTKETEEQEIGTMAWSGSTAETWRPESDAPGDILVSGDEKVDSPELSARKLEEF